MKIIIAFILFFCSELAYSNTEELKHLNISFVFLSPANCLQNQIDCKSLPSHSQEWESKKIDFITKILNNYQVTKTTLLSEITSPQYLVTSNQKGLAETGKIGGKSFIHLKKDFFENDFVLPLNSGQLISYRYHILIHELVHSWSQDQQSFDSLLASLEKTLGWDYGKGFHPYISTPKYHEVWSKRENLVSEKKYDKAFLLDEDYSFSLGFPSMYSMVSSNEYFAELIATLSYTNAPSSFLTAEVVNFLKTATPFGKLVEDVKFKEALPYSRTKNLKEHIGYISLDNKPLCTVSILKHGLILSAKHCFKNIKPQVYNTKAKPTFLKISFPYSKDKVFFSGLSFKKIEIDPNFNDIALIHYDPELTLNKVELPSIHLNQSLLTETSLESSELINWAYTIPNKPRELITLKSSCRLTGLTGYLYQTLEDYEGELHDSTCPSYYLGSGSPVYTEINGELYIVGLISHTFSMNQKGTPLKDSIKKDFWGNYTTSNISLVASSSLLFPPVPLNQNQHLFIQVIEQKLREALDHLNSSIVETQLRTHINIATTSTGLTKEQIYLHVMETLRQKPYDNPNFLIEEESFYSLEPLERNQIVKASALLKSIL